ncbi:MAG: site-2 protease family protein [Bacteroidota bacterium]
MKIKTKDLLIHSALFIASFFTISLAGVQWLNIDFTQLYNFQFGIPYSLSILFILATHEFGHYFAALYHKVKSSLPYFLPFPIIPGFLNFGTLGAVIKTKSPIPNSKALFDIGVYGPIAGFFASIIILIIGFTNLPNEKFILQIHPNYFSSTQTEGVSFSFGTSIIFEAIKFIFADSSSHFIPPMSEIYHYPFLCAGWFGLFITMMNLVPIGQLDGGHIIFAMFPKFQFTIAKIFLAILIFLGLIDFFPILSSFNINGWNGWLFWSAILFFFIKLKHPPIDEIVELDSNRKLIGYFAILIFILSFIASPFPIY